MEDKGTIIGSEGLGQTTSSLWDFFHVLHLSSASENFSVSCFSSPLLLIALALLCREFFHIFSLLWEFALRQALLQCFCTKQGTSMLKHPHWSELLPYSKNFWVTRPLSLRPTLYSVVFYPSQRWIPLCSLKLCPLKLRKSKGDLHIQGQGSTHPFLEAMHSPYYSAS